MFLFSFFFLFLADKGVETGCGVGDSGADEATKLSEETGCGVGGSGAMKLGEETGRRVGSSVADEATTKLDME